MCVHGMPKFINFCNDLNDDEVKRFLKTKNGRFWTWVVEMEMEDFSRRLPPESTSAEGLLSK